MPKTLLLYRQGPWISRSILVMAVGFVLIFTATRQARADLPAIALDPKDRILVLAPHPDDEVLGCGGIIQRAVSMKLPVKVVFLTYGDSNQWSFMLYRKHFVFMPGAVQKMGLVRRDEAIAASNILGLLPKDLTFLGYPDFGTLNIWYSHWNARAAYKGIMTRATAVPYEGSLRLNAPYKGEEILKDLEVVLAEFKPTKVFVSSPADHNGDHLSLYLFLRVALWDTRQDKNVKIYPYLIHYPGWPKPKGFHPDKLQQPPDVFKDRIFWRQYLLTPAEFDIKKAALAAHKSQYRSTPKYLLSFIKHNEIFGDFPSIRLKVNKDSSVFSTGRKFVPTADLPEGLIDKERLAFIGVEWKFVRLQGNDLVISIELTKPLAQDVEASIYIFGYNKHVPFGKMPKINVKLGFMSYTVYDQAKRVSQDIVTVDRKEAKSIVIRVPLKNLGNPDRILTSARTYLGNVPLDTSSWITMEMD